MRDEEMIGISEYCIIFLYREIDTLILKVIYVNELSLRFFPFTEERESEIVVRECLV